MILMANWGKAEELVSNYIVFWQKQRGTSKGIWEDNDFGSENLQLLSNDFNFHDFNHDELIKSSVLLTRELQAQINRDHKFYWAYAAFLTHHLRTITLFKDLEWQTAFEGLVNLILAKSRPQEQIAPPKKVEEFFKQNETQEAARSVLAPFVNSHFINILKAKWEVSAPLTFAILEGLLRRKNSHYMNIDGSITDDFEAVSNTGRTKYSRQYRKRINRIGDSLRCFEQFELPAQHRTCPYLQGFKIEACLLNLVPPTSDVWEMIDNWRNQLMHGNEYWTVKVPMLINLICLLVLDEIEPAVYSSQQSYLQGRVRSERVRRTELTFDCWGIYPPDL
jgi:hypothetical protein